MDKNLEKAIEYLNKAHDSLSIYLDGKNKRGLLSNIKNEITYILEYVKYKNEMREAK